jgi:hypothetical protein
VNSGPDFIIIGAMKCATTTLHEQLAQLPGVFMTTPKEPNFFSDDSQWRRGIEWYRSLFAPARDTDLTGESSTHYTKLPTYPRTIERMKQVVKPDVRLIYIMRDPIDRLISQYIHEWTQRVISEPIDLAIERHPELVAYSRYAMQLQRYVEAFGREAILPVFFEHLSAEPQAELERVCRHIGYRGAPRWNASLAASNVSTERRRTLPLVDPLLNLKLMKRLRRTLVPQTIRERIKRPLTMRQRPQLSDACRGTVCDTLDEDLRVLNAWFGLELTCASFKRIASVTMPQWMPQSRSIAVEHVA